MNRKVGGVLKRERENEIEIENREGRKGGRDGGWEQAKQGARKGQS